MQLSFSYAQLNPLNMLRNESLVVLCSRDGRSIPFVHIFNKGAGSPVIVKIGPDSKQFTCFSMHDASEEAMRVRAAAVKMTCGGTMWPSTPDTPIDSAPVASYSYESRPVPRAPRKRTLPSPAVDAEMQAAMSCFARTASVEEGAIGLIAMTYVSDAFSLPPSNMIPPPHVSPNSDDDDGVEDEEELSSFLPDHEAVEQFARFRSVQDPQGKEYMSASKHHLQPYGLKSVIGGDIIKGSFTKNDAQLLLHLSYFKAPVRTRSQCDNHAKAFVAVLNEKHKEW